MDCWWWIDWVDLGGGRVGIRNVDGNGMGSAVGDYDNDGDNDWFVSSIYDVADAKIGNRLCRNHMGAFEDVSDGNFLRIKLRGVAPNTEAVGACIRVTSDSITQLREIMVGSNFVSQNPTLQVFGLGM